MQNTMPPSRQPPPPITLYHNQLPDPETISFSSPLPTPISITYTIIEVDLHSRHHHLKPMILPPPSAPSTLTGRLWSPRVTTSKRPTTYINTLTAPQPRQIYHSFSLKILPFLSLISPPPSEQSRLSNSDLQFRFDNPRQPVLFIYLKTFFFWWTKWE